MPFGSLNRLHKKLGFRLTLWYSAIFIVSSVTLSIISYSFLSSSLRDNRKTIQAKLEQVTALGRESGVTAIERIATAGPAPNRRSSAFFIRVLDPKDKVVFLSSPKLWQEFEVETLDHQSAYGAWQYVPSKKDGDLMELTSAPLPNGFTVQVGKPLEDRSEILEHYRDTIVGVISGMIVIGLAGGAFFAFRALRPVRDLIQTTQSIVSTGRIDARVPESGSGDELDELTKLFNRMLERIETLIRGMKQALDNVAHDLRTSMTRLRGAAEVALQASPSEEQLQEALINSVEESDRILKLLDCLMDISEAETGTMRLHFETIKVSVLVEEILDLYQYAAEEKNVSISVECSKDLVITADRNRLRQVLANLLDNAIKYNSTGGHVLINVRQEQQEMIVVVNDNGIGIPPKEIPKIWDRLHRGDESRSQPGLGLGLSLVKAIVHAHKGHIEVHSQPGVGSAFALGLPTVRPPGN